MNELLFYSLPEMTLNQVHSSDKYICSNILPVCALLLHGLSGPFYP